MFTWLSQKKRSRTFSTTTRWTLYWVTSKGVYRINTQNDTDGICRIFSLIGTGLQPTGLALDRATDNLYLSGVDGYNPESVIKVISTEALNKSVDLVTSHQTVITDVVIECGRGLLFWSERLMPRTSRIICSTMDGSLMKWKLKNTVHPMALALDPIQGRVYWADFILHSISSCDYNGQKKKLEVKYTNGQPLSITFFESQIT